MIKTVAVNFKLDNINPFTGLSYDNSWAILYLTDTDEYQMMNGGENSDVYVLKISKRYLGWKMAVMDFTEYNKSIGKNIILSISEYDLHEAERAYAGHSYNECRLRDDEANVLVHSTTLENWKGIKSDSCLKSWRALKNERKDWEKAPIGKQLGDSDDFCDYIMFSNGGVSGEIVVASKQKGKIEMNAEEKYVPGVRMYFDAKKIAEDGLLIRDGAHLKVKNKMFLEPYLIFVADWKNIGLKENISTPQEFSRLADFAFANRTV